MTIIGIRHEDKNEWEARVPLVPEHVQVLCRESDIHFIVQPSRIRAFSDAEYARAGAEVAEDLSPCQLVLAVKEIPPSFFQAERTYVFFSHTIKGQPHNMPMLKRMIELKTSLIDYERIVDEKGKRLVFFGRYAGIAGMIDTVRALGQRLVVEGVPSVLADVKSTLEYGSLANAREAFVQLGEQIVQQGLPAIGTPIIFGFTGYGHVSSGAQEIFDLLPHIELSPDELPAFAQSGKFSAKHIYKVVFREADLVQPREPGKDFDLQEYYQQPELYTSKFERFLPHLTVLVNAIYWDQRYPRLVTKAYLRQASVAGQPTYPRVIGDITCDVEGSIECNVECSTPGNPVYVYEPLMDGIRYGVTGHGPVILAVDNLPCELPRDASRMFSDVLREFIPALARCDFTRKFEELDLPESLKKALILLRGKFTPDYRYMSKYVQK